MDAGVDWIWGGGRVLHLGVMVVREHPTFRVVTIRERSEIQGSGRGGGRVKRPDWVDGRVEEMRRRYEEGLDLWTGEAMDVC